MPLINLTMTGTFSQLAAAFAAVVNAINTSGAVLQGQVRITLVAALPDFVSLANATGTVNATLTVNAFGALQTLKTALAAVKVANPNVSFTLNYAEEQTV